MIIFKDIWVLFFIPLVVAAFYFFKSLRRPSSFRFSSSDFFPKARLSPRVVLAGNLHVLRIIVIILFILALARPRVPVDEAKVQTEGIDIVLAIDASGSMRAADFMSGTNRRNRLDVVKKVVENFILGRVNDRIGMIAFAARAYTVCPLTLDYDWLIENLKRIEIGAIEDGTAIGSAISSSLNRLKDTQAKAKIIVLLTDGINNSGKIPPLTSAEAAKALGIKIYTIGAGTKGLVPFPVKTIWGETVYKNVRIEIDERTLHGVALHTGGKYFRATDTESLTKIYKEIDAMEKTEIEEVGFQEYKELFPRFLIAGLFLLLAEIILNNTYLRKIP